MNREECIKKLHDHDVFKAAVSKASTDAERRAIKAFSEEFLLSFFDVIQELKRNYESDPTAFQNVLSEIQQQHVLTGSVGV